MHEVKQINRVDYIVVKEGDTRESLRKEMELVGNELDRYNELDPAEPLREGEILYLQPKRNRAGRGSDIHRVEEGETMWDISQAYGVKLEKLYQKNHMAPGTQPEAGDTIYLRKKKKAALFPLKVDDDDKPSEKIRIEFDDN